MKRPALSEDAFLADVSLARDPATWGHSPGELDVWWLGQSGFLLHHAGHLLLLDPYLSDSLTRKYAATDKPHVRMTERVIDPRRLEGIALVTASHAHTDHLDPETLHALAGGNPSLLLACPEAIRATARERSGLPDTRILGFDVPGSSPPASALPASETTRVGVDGSPGSPRPIPGTPFALTAVPAAHETMDRDGNGHLLYLGFVVQVGPFRIYHSGDTVRFDGMAGILAPFQVDLALLPINGRAPERKVAGNLRGGEAAVLARDIGARWVIPCHYDMFEFNTATPDEFVEECLRLNQPHQIMGQGSRFSVRAR